MRGGVTPRRPYGDRRIGRSWFLGIEGRHERFRAFSCEGCLERRIEEVTEVFLAWLRWRRLKFDLPGVRRPHAWCGKNASRWRGGRRRRRIKGQRRVAITGPSQAITGNHRPARGRRPRGSSALRLGTGPQAPVLVQRPASGPSSLDPRSHTPLPQSARAVPDAPA